MPRAISEHSVICHGNGGAHHACSSVGVVRVQWNGRGTVYQVCPRARKEWDADAVANDQADMKLTDYEEGT